MKTTIPMLAVTLLLAGEGAALTPAQKFNTAWQAAPDPVMSVVGTHDEMTGCDQLYVRRSVDTSVDDPDNGDFLVYCTTDGKKFTAWEVVPTEDRATGPMPLPPGIPLPNPRTIRQSDF